VLAVVLSADLPYARMDLAPSTEVLRRPQ